MTEAGFLVAQISDCHVTAAPGGHPRLGDTAAFLSRAVDHVNALRPRPDVVFATGDLCDPGTPEDYALLRSLLGRLAMPVYVLPGNHDLRDRMRAAFPETPWAAGESLFLHYVVEELPLRLLALDTIVPGEDGGLLCERRLSWIADRLAEQPERPTLVFMHHPPAEIGLPYIDVMRCQGGEALGAIVARHSAVVSVACGHVHRPAHLAWYGTIVVTAPSTCMQFPLEFATDVAIAPVAEPPACRLYQWRDGRLITHLGYIG